MNLSTATHPIWNLLYFIVGCSTVVGMTFAMAEHVDTEAWTMIVGSIAWGVRELIGWIVNKKTRRIYNSLRVRAQQTGDTEEDKFLTDSWEN
jgi:hypothetical protein